MKTIVAALLIAVFGAAPAGYAAAQAANPTKAAAAKISDQDLRTFAAIRRDLNRISTEYMARLKAAATTEQRTQVRQNARKAIVAAIEKHGMTLNQFRDMAKAISQSPELQQKLEAMEPDGG
jgi:hypothetical protein